MTIPTKVGDFVFVCFNGIQGHWGASVGTVRFKVTAVVGRQILVHDHRNGATYTIDSWIRCK